MKSKQQNNLNIIQVLKALQKEPLTKDELQEKFKIKSKTFYKYMKYFKDAKFDVQSKKNKFSVNKYSKNIILNNCDIEFISTLYSICEKVLTKDEGIKLDEIINKILLVSDSNAYNQVQEKFLKNKEKNNFDEYKLKVNLFETFLKNNILVKVILKSKSVFKGKPYKITLNKNRVYFNFLTNEGKIKKILAERIIDIQPENIIKTINQEEKETIFEIYGNLAKTYVLREDEVIISNFENGIRIANTQKDKNLLFKRLLRYDILCKIIYPNSDKIKFKQLINTALDNICGD